jgi:hypothetical protein
LTHHQARSPQCLGFIPRRAHPDVAFCLDEIDAIIAREITVKALANARARRAAWRTVEKNTADCAACGSEG